jgi:hypothetical protein
VSAPISSGSAASVWHSRSSSERSAVRQRL